MIGRDASISAPAPSQSTIVLLISLYLILLCTFILLNSYANLEQKKTQRVIDGVRQSFVGKSAIVPERIQPAETSETRQSVEVLPNLRSYLQQAYPQALRMEKAGVNQIVLTFPQAIFFREQTLNLTTGAKEALQEMATTLQNGDAGNQYKMRIEWDVPDIYLAYGNPKQIDLNRLGEIARTIKSPELKPNSISISFRKSKAQSVRFHFIAGGE